MQRFQRWGWAVLLLGFPWVVGRPSLAAPVAPPAQSLEQAWEAMVRAADVTPAPVVEDAAFVRRVTLDLWGRIPTAAAAQAFVADPSVDKRARLVERMVEAPEFARYQAQVLSDVLIGTALRGPAARAREPLEAYLEDAVAHGVGWDTVVKSLLNVNGTPTQPGQAAFVAVHGSKGGGAEELARAVASDLLGIQMQCAQCHDHPYDARWKQEDFHALAAYVATVKVRLDKDGPERSVRVVDRGRARQVMTTPKGEKRTVEPRFLGRLLLRQAGEGPRDVLARAVVESDLFAKAAVNRAWAQLFGRGLVHPWNDLGGEQDQGHPALLMQLARQFAEHGHDLRWLYRTLALTPAYQRSSAGGSPGTAAQRVFARAAVRPLSPRQLLNSLLLATGVEDLARLRRGDSAAERELTRLRRQYQFVFGDDEEGDVEAFDGNVPQALMLFNGELVRRGVRPHPASPLAELLGRTSGDPDALLTQLGWLCYTRPPTDAERTAWRELLRGQPLRDGSEDLLHAMLASTEFTTNH